MSIFTESKQSKRTDHIFIDTHARRNHFIIGLLVLLMPAVQGASARQTKTQGKPDPQDQSIHLKADLMEIRAVVTDKQGKAVTDLNKEDFEILENGRGQLISFFSAERLSVERRAPDLPGASPAGRRQASPTTRPKRTIVMFADTLHMSTSSMLLLKRDLLKFIDEQLGDEDLAAVVSTGGGLGLFSQFTQDKRVLRAAVNRLSTSPGTYSSTYTPFLASRVQARDAGAIAVAMSIIRQEEHLPADDLFASVVANITLSRAGEIMAEATYQRRATLNTLKAVAARLAELPGQRLVLFASDGFTSLDNSGTLDLDDLRAAISRASRSGVVIYAVNARGLKGNALYDIGTRLLPEPEVISKFHHYSAAGEREMESGMETLAKDTGGKAFLTTNDLAGAMGKALDENSSYYVLSYYPANADDKKTFRSIKVRIKGHADYTVRTQSGYLAGDRLKEKTLAVVDPAEALIKAMGEPLVTTDINVEANAEFFYTAADQMQVSLTVFINCAKLGYKQQDNGPEINLLMMTGILDTDGTTTDMLQDVIQVRLSGEYPEQAKDKLLRYVKRLTLKPGLHQIRVGVRDSRTELKGTAAAWVEVPNLKSKKLILGSLSTARVPSDNNNGAAPNVTLIQPDIHNGSNVFQRGDMITFYGKAYKAALGNEDAAGVMIQGQILQDEKIVLEDAWHPLSSFILNKEPDAVEFGSRLKAPDFKPGLYTLRILVKEPQSKIVQTKETSFEIAP
jgi:VWFA-related protein